MLLFCTENDTVRVTEEMVTMSDGVRLYTRYALPAGAGKCPTVFIRTPYEPKNGGKPYPLSAYEGAGLAAQLIAHGYAVVTQHCRGKGDSEGVCVPYAEEERTDGLDTLAYIRTLPFYNREIYLTGGSYLATVHLSYLSAQPADVRGICLEIQTDRLYYRNFRNGLNYRLNNIGWWSGMMDRKHPKRNLGAADKLPYAEAALRVFGKDEPSFTEGLIHNECDEYWKKDEKWNVVETLTAPTLLVEGWYDFYVEGMVDMWRRLPEKTKAASAMLVGPWGHGTAVGADFEYPLPNGNLPPDYVVEWFDSIREGRPYRYAEYGKLHYYSIGADAWHTAAYPTKGETTRLYFGTHTLSDTETAGAALSYRYDPDALANVFKSFGIYRAHAAGSIDSILSFVGEPCEEERAFLGSVRFHLNVSSDCEDTAYFARLYLVDGEEAYNLTEAMGALSHFVSTYTPGEVATVEMETPAIAFTLKKGMRLRVDIASESGNYLPHANVKGHFAYVTERRVAHNTVYTEGSYRELPFEG